MEISGSEFTGASGGPTAFALSVDTASIVNKIASVQEARALPPGSIVGDLHGGLTFTDAVAAALEARSSSGWREIQVPSGETWTLIVLNR
jgi:hypothetical protein